MRWESYSKLHTKNIFLLGFIANNTYASCFWKNHFHCWHGSTLKNIFLQILACQFGESILISKIRYAYALEEKDVCIKGFAWSRGYTLPAIAFMKRDVLMRQLLLPLLYLYLSAGRNVRSASLAHEKFASIRRCACRCTRNKCSIFVLIDWVLWFFMR